jgi:hypothetical protein
MTEIAPSHSRTSLWSRIWNFLRAFDEAVHATDTDSILSRLDRLERAVIELREPEVLTVRPRQAIDDPSPHRLTSLSMRFD